MARTPLLRALRRLAADHLLADEHDLPVEAIREARQRARDRGPSRRQFLGAAAAGAAALALPRAARASGDPPLAIAIVGGGIAGLSCALALRDAGVPATIYEASGRIGGRMFSNRTYWNEGQVSEWYGELIDTGHVTVQDLATRFGLTLDNLPDAEPSGAEEIYHFYGGYYPKADADRDFREIRRALRIDNRDADYPTTYNQSTAAGRRLDEMSVFDWIEWRVPGGHGSPLGALLDVAYTTEYAAETTDQSALNLVYLMGEQPRPGKLSLFGVSDETYHIRGGNQRLPEAIAAHLASCGAPVQTGMRMVALRRTSGGRYEITFQSGNSTREVCADIVVLTLPFAALRGLDIDRAGFDRRKLRAIRELGRGRSAKLQLQCSRRAWAGRGPWPGVSGGSSFSDRGYQATWEVTRGQPGGSGIINNFLGGDTVDGLRARAALGTSGNASVRDSARAFLQQVDAVYPDLPWNGKATLSVPHLDGNLGLSYAYWRVGQYQSIAGYEAVPQGGVYFAGEHTSVDAQGYMEGGAASGQSAAADILAALGRA